MSTKSPNTTLPSFDERPLVTFAILAYNQENFIRDAIEGAFAQTYSPLEIILSDDCSDDRTFAIIEEMAESYRGEHRIVTNRNARNINIGGHVARIFELASGEWIILAAGDDVSENNRTSVIVSRFLQNRNCKAVLTDYMEMGPDGEPWRSHVRTWNKQRMPLLKDMCAGGGGVGLGAVYAYHRDTGAWPWTYPVHLMNEDRILPFRACLLGEVCHISLPLVRYRISNHGVSRSSKLSNIVALNKPDHRAEIEKMLVAAVMNKNISSFMGRIYLHLRDVSQQLFLTAEEVESSRGLANFSYRLKRKALWLYRNALARVV